MIPLLADHERRCAYVECGERSLGDRNANVVLIDSVELPITGALYGNYSRRRKMNWPMQAQAADVKRSPDSLEGDGPRRRDTRWKLKMTIDMAPVFLEEIVGVRRSFPIYFDDWPLLDNGAGITRRRLTRLKARRRIGR